MKLIISTLIITAGATITLCHFATKCHQLQMAKQGFEEVVSEQKGGNIVLWQKPAQTLMLKMPTELGELFKPGSPENGKN
jgi:hypothetical protein